MENNYNLIISGNKSTEDFVKMKQKFIERPPMCDYTISTKENLSYTQAILYCNNKEICIWNSYISPTIVNLKIKEYEKMVK